ncbi:MAG TPA: acyl-CoA thioesterase domain-containing protein [Euzebya sp.]|nr:acyl-CoA thioesterase domain-containing protein [Euzebya sp.]
MGLGVNAVLSDLGERRLLAVTTHFVAPARLGRVEITVGHIDRTAAGTTTDARIQQSGQVIARLLLTTVTGPDPQQGTQPGAQD